MSKNSEIIEDFKKSLSATIKSIGKKEDIEINFVKENPSIIGNTINLTEPKIENFKNNLEYLRAEADSFALEFRLHSKDIHQNFLNQDELSNKIINVLEQARVEAIGLSLIHISEPTRRRGISYAVFCLKKKTKTDHH